MKPYKITTADKARAAWSMYSFMIWPENERGRVTPEKVRNLADVMERRKCEGRAADWPDALRKIADEIEGAS